MGSYAYISRGERRSRPEEVWSEVEWTPALAAKDDASGLADWIVGTSRFCDEASGEGLPTGSRETVINRLASEVVRRRAVARGGFGR